jgi:hypothetical protein
MIVSVAEAAVRHQTHAQQPPSQLDRSRVVAFGRGDRAVGPAAARALLGKLGERRPGPQGQPREARTADWGFMHANGDLPIAGEALPAIGAMELIALSDANGGWSVVGVHYVAL